MNREILCAVFVMILVMLVSTSAETIEKPVVGVTWRSHQDSESFVAVCKAIEAAGGKPVVLDRVMSADLDYDAGMLDDGTDNEGALDEVAEEAPFTQWNPDAPALNALIEYVEAVTDPDSPDFIPEADRIATFDLDGTLMAELAPTYMENVLLMRRVFDDPSYLPDAEMVEFCRLMRDHALDKSFPEGFEYEFSSHLAKAFAGMTPDEYTDYVTRFLVTEADGL